MLQLKTKAIDICRISKLLAKHNDKASISNGIITLYGEVSAKLLDELCNGTTIYNVQNFSSEVLPSVNKGTNFPESSETISTATEVEAVVPKIHSNEVNAQTDMEEYDLLYPTVRRGEVYFCDFGKPYGSEEGHKRYAIVVQNNDGNFHSPTTIVLACTTEEKAKIPVHYSFTFSNENMIDYDVLRIGVEQNIVVAEQIKTINKTRLRKFLGTMTPEFMDRVQELIDISLGLQIEEKIITKTEKVYINNPMYKHVPDNANETKKCKDLNMVQIQLLSLVDINELLKIAQTRDSDKIKAEKIIKLFGFDMQKNGIQYLLKAILISPKEAYFNLETLCDSVAKSEQGTQKDEIKRLIVARIKEKFKFRKSPTIDFIRLVNSFLMKDEEKQDEEHGI